MIKTLIAFFMLINPFALFLYLVRVMRKLKHKAYCRMLFEATAISFVVYVIFLLIGESMFTKVFNVSFESFRIFGGIVIFSYAYHYIVKGEKALIHIRPNIEEIAEEVAIPFIVGAGTISLTILLSHEASWPLGASAIAGILALNYFIIVGLKWLRDHIQHRTLRIVFDKNLEILLRILGFFLGAIGVDMFVIGVKNVFFS